MASAGVRGREPRLGEQGREQQVGVGVVLAHGAQHLVRDASRGLHARGGALGRRSASDVIARRPASRRGPRHQSAAGIARLPAGCTSSSSSGVDAVPANTPSAALLDLAGSEPRDVVGDGRRMHLEPLGVDHREGARLGSDAADVRVDGRGILGPVEPAVVEGELRGEGRARPPAASRAAVPAASSSTTPASRAAPDAARASSRCPAVWLRPIGARLHREDVAGVEFGHELEDRGAGLLIAGHDRALHGSRAAPARQQREVQVDPAEPRGAEQRLAHQTAVRDDHAEIGFQRDQFICDWL